MATWTTRGRCTNARGGVDKSNSLTHSVRLWLRLEGTCEPGCGSHGARTPLGRTSGPRGRGSALTRNPGGRVSVERGGRAPSGGVVTRARMAPSNLEGSWGSAAGDPVMTNGDTVC
eukprot:scaffold827_cov369-Prasinococcus_capsulatus_cf.AAC.18